MPFCLLPFLLMAGGRKLEIRLGGRLEYVDGRQGTKVDSNGLRAGVEGLKK